MKAAVILMMAYSASAQLTTITSWEGDDGTSSGGVPTYGNHGDPQVCISATSVLQVTGQDITAWDKSGNVLSGYPIATPTFLANNSGSSITQANDPRCTYNPHTDRFYVAEGTNLGPLLNVSSSSDLSTATWKAITLASGQGGDTTPHLGWNKWWVVVTHDDITSTTNYLVRVIPGADTAWTGGGTISLTNMYTSGQIDFESIPATDRSTTTLVTDPLLVSGRGTPAQNCSNCTVTLHTRQITGSDSTHPTLSGLTDIVTATVYNTPNTGPNQPGTSTPIRTTESHRVTQLTQIGTHCYLTMETGPTTGETYNGFVAFDINPSALTLTTTKRVFGGSTDAYIFVSPIVDTSGNLVICGTRYSNTVYGSVACWYSTDQLATLTGPTTMYAGTVAYPVSGANAGWGTYGSTVYDPSTSTFWATGQYGGSTTVYQWTTRVVKMSLGASTTGGSAISGTIGGKVVVQ